MLLQPRSPIKKVVNIMPVSKAQQKATNKYIAKAYDRVNLTLPKGQKDVIQAHAVARGESVNGFIGRAITEAMKRDSGGTSVQAAVEASERTEGGGGILTPVTLETATEAAQKTGETLSAFLERAVSTQASRDALSLNMGLNPAQSAKDE